MQLIYPAGGWLPQGASLNFQRDDQGKDLVTNWNGIIQAPGKGHCVHNLSDNPFPNGFGPNYPVVWIDDGPFGGHYWYIGHTSSLVGEGEHFDFGHPLSRANQGHPSDIGISVPGNGGWVELGEAPGGYPGSASDSHWFDQALATPRIITVPDPDPNHYQWFANDIWSTPFGKMRERDVVLHYDGARPHWIKYFLYLKTLRKQLKFLADRVAHEAIYDPKTQKRRSKPDWNTYNRGWRFQQLIKRSHGDRLNVDFKP